jgi:hypothetical protein
MVATAENFVPDFVVCVGISDNNLFALDDHFTVDGSRIVGSSLAAPAERLNLKSLNAIREFDQPCGTWEERGSEVCEDAKSEDIDA